MTNAPSAQPPDDEGDVFGPVGFWLLFVLRAPFRHRVLAGGIVLAFLALGLIAGWALPSKYEVRATILAQRNALMGTLSNPGVNRDWDIPTRAAREVVIRRDNLIALCQQTDFVRRYRATRAPAVRLRDWVTGTLLRNQRSDPQILDGLVSALEERLWVVVGNEGTVSIGFTWSDPEITYQVVQAAVQSFLEARNASEIGATGEAIAILQSHDSRVQREIAVAIDRLDEKERSLRIHVAPRRSPVVLSRPKADDDLIRVKALLAARRRALADVEEFRQRRLSELQAQLEQNLSVYAAEHPTVVATRQAIAGLSTPSPQVAELRAEIAQLERDFKHRGGDDREAPGRGTAAVEEGLAAARARLLENEDPRLEYERRQLETLLRRHAALLERIESAQIELDTAQVAFEQRYTVISPPKRPRGPLKPYRIMYAMGALALGLGASFMTSAVLDILRGRIVERWQVERTLKLPVITDIHPR